jgi:hypothetical protein
MPVVTFIGKIHPPVLHISIQGMPTVTWEASDIGLTMTFSFRIHESDVRVECDVNRYKPDDFIPVYMRAFDLVRGAVDLACFSTGIGATVTLDAFIGPDGVQLAILSRDERLASICTAFTLGPPPNPDFAAALNIVLGNPSLFMAMNDLITAITLPHHSSVTCARTLERLRHIIAPGQDPKPGWEALQNNLNLEKSYVQFVTKYSIGPRHGDPEHIPGVVTTELTKRTWVIMNRFLEFRKRGNIPLPIAEFPMML